MIIRSSSYLQAEATTRRLKMLREQLNRQTVIATSGLKVQTVQDAAGFWRQIDTLQESDLNLQTFIENGERAEAILNVADAALGQGADILSSARALAVYMSSDAFDDTDRFDGAIEVDQMIESLVQVGNTQYGERYLFAGTAYDNVAFDAAGTYQGSTDLPSTQVSEITFIATGFDGSAAIVPALDVLRDLATALRSGAGSSQAVADQLVALDDAFQGLVSARQSVGHEQSDVIRANDLSRALKINVLDALNTIVTEDPIDSFTRLNELDNAYQIALQVTAQTSADTLFDYLR